MGKEVGLAPDSKGDADETAGDAGAGAGDHSPRP